MQEKPLFKSCRPLRVYSIVIKTETVKVKVEFVVSLEKHRKAADVVDLVRGSRVEAFGGFSVCFYDGPR